MSDPVSVRYKDALQRGHVAVVKGRPREAISHYQEAASLVPGSAAAVHSASATSTSAWSSRAKPSKPSRPPSSGRLPIARPWRARPLRWPRADGSMRPARPAPGPHEIEALERAGRQRRQPADPRLLEIEQHVINGAAARAAGDLGVASAAFLAAANGYVAINDFDAAIDACLRGLEARPGNIDIHFVMAMLYLRRGWVELGVQRVLLIAHRLDIDDDPLRRNALAALARDFRTLSPELERLASGAS